MNVISLAELNSFSYMSVFRGLSICKSLVLAGFPFCHLQPAPTPDPRHTQGHWWWVQMDRDCSPSLAPYIGMCFGASHFTSLH